MRIVELSAPGVHKAAGVASAAKLLGRDPADVLAFGDAPNDSEMLAAAAWGVAMGNAHPDVVAIADEQTPRTRRMAWPSCSNDCSAYPPTPCT